MAEVDDDLYDVYSNVCYKVRHPAIGIKNPNNYRSSVLQTDVEYVWEWFHKAGVGKKPPLSFLLNASSDLATSRKWTWSFLKGDRIGTSCPTDYLYHLFSTIKGTLPAEWKSYNISIPAGEVTPLSFLDVQVTNGQRTVQPRLNIRQPDSFGPLWDHYMLIICAGLYRYSRIHPLQKGVFAEKLRIAAGGVKPNNEVGWDLAEASGNVDLLEGDPNIAKLLSALDLFLYTFPDHMYAKARVGTFVLRYHGCSAIRDIIHFNKLLGKKRPFDATYWMFHTQIQLEVNQILKHEQEEYDSPNSYFPYILGLGLSRKSPYAAINNPYIHLIIHGVGALLGNNRSKNTALLGDPSPFICAINIGMIYIAHKSTRRLQEREARAVNIENVQDRASFIDPNEWFAYFKNKGFAFPQGDYEQMQLACEKISQVRNGSIGEWVKQHLMSLLRRIE